MIAYASFCENVHNLSAGLNIYILRHCQRWLSRLRLSYQVLLPHTLPAWFHSHPGFCNGFRKASGPDPSCCKRILFTTSSFIFLLLLECSWCAIPRPLCCASSRAKTLIPPMYNGTDKFSASLDAFIHSNKKPSLEWGKYIDFLSSLIHSRFKEPQRRLDYTNFINMNKRGLFVIRFRYLTFGFLSY